MNKEAYIEGYQEKQAGPVAAGMYGLSSLLDKLRMAALVAPAAVGASAGTLASIMTSPTGLDVGNLQKKVQASELEEALAYMKRQKAMSTTIEKGNSASATEREIHI